MSNLLEQVVASYLGAKIQREHILNYNGANLAFQHAADMANKLKLTPDQARLVTPFPSPTSVTVSGSQGGIGQWLGPMLTGAALTLGGGALGYLASGDGEKPVAPPQQPALEASLGNVGFTVE